MPLRPASVPRMVQRIGKGVSQGAGLLLLLFTIFSFIGREPGSPFALLTRGSGYGEEAFFVSIPFGIGVAVSMSLLDYVAVKSRHLSWKVRQQWVAQAHRRLKEAHLLGLWKPAGVVATLAAVTAVLWLVTGGLLWLAIDRAAEGGDVTWEPPAYFVLVLLALAFVGALLVLPVWPHRTLLVDDALNPYDESGRPLAPVAPPPGFGVSPYPVPPPAASYPVPPAAAPYSVPPPAPSYRQPTPAAYPPTSFAAGYPAVPGGPPPVRPAPVPVRSGGWRIAAIVLGVVALVAALVVAALMVGPRLMNQGASDPRDLIGRFYEAGVVCTGVEQLADFGDVRAAWCATADGKAITVYTYADSVDRASWLASTACSDGTARRVAAVFGEKSVVTVQAFTREGSTALGTARDLQQVLGGDVDTYRCPAG